MHGNADRYVAEPIELFEISIAKCVVNSRVTVCRIGGVQLVAASDVGKPIVCLNGVINGKSVVTRYAKGVPDSQVSEATNGILYNCRVGFHCIYRLRFHDTPLAFRKTAGLERQNLPNTESVRHGLSLDKGSTARSACSVEGCTSLRWR